jgi:hypothetical protein
MHGTNVVDLVLWAGQAFLALFFLLAGAPKIVGRGIDRWTGFSDMPRPLVITIGLAEVLGSAGLILPMASGVLPWLTPLASVGLGLIVLMATGFHLRADERLQALETGLWAVTAGGVAIGRWHLVLSAVRVPPSAVAIALSVLVPAVIVNIIILLRRPPPSAEPLR